MEGRYLHSPDPRIRRWSAVVYSIASAVAAVAWTAWGGVRQLTDGRYVHMLWLTPEALLVWFVVAGIGLRIVRRYARTIPSEPASRG